jgi:hypothetical protein
MSVNYTQLVKSNRPELKDNSAHTYAASLRAIEPDGNGSSTTWLRKGNVLYFDDTDNQNSFAAGTSKVRGVGIATHSSDTYTNTICRTPYIGSLTPSPSPPPPAPLQAPAPP